MEKAIVQFKLKIRLSGKVHKENFIKNPLKFSSHRQVGARYSCAQCSNVSATLKLEMNPFAF